MSNDELKIIEDYSIRKQTEYGSTLYHYTDICALNGMIFGERQLWLGNASIMNDTKEVINFIDSLKQACLEHTKNCFADKYNSFFERVYFKAKTSYPYLMSFSKNCDDVANWERYASHAMGLCLEFNTKNIVKIMAVVDMGAFLSDVYYDYVIKEHTLFSIVKKYVESGVIDEFSNEEELLDSIVYTASSYKHSSFKCENEVRAIVLSCFKKSKFISKGFETIRGTVKDYLKINLSSVCSELGIDIQDLFNGIVVGPRSKQDVVIFKKYLCDNGYTKLASITRKSNCPIR